MPQTSTAARQDAAAPLPRGPHRPYDGEPIAIPRDPDRDRALSDRAQKVLKAVLSGTADDPDLPGRRRWCAWMDNATLLGLIDDLGEPKDKSYRDRGLAELVAKGRLVRLNLTQFADWLMTEAPRRGMPSERPSRMRKTRGRVLIVVAELPPVVNDGYGPLLLPPPQESEFLNLRNSIPQPEESEFLNLRSANRSEIRSDFPEMEPVTSRETTDGLKPGNLGTKSGETPQIEGIEFLAPEQLAWLNCPRSSPLYKLALATIAKGKAERDNPPPKIVPVAPARPVAPPVAATTAVETPPALDRPTGRLHGPEATRAMELVESVHQGTIEPAAAALRLGELARDTKSVTLDCYRRGLESVADGRASLEEARAVIRDAASKGIRNANRILSMAFGEFARRVKKPADASLAKGRVGGPQ